MADFPTVEISGHYVDMPEREIRLIEQGTPKDCGYRLGEIHRLDGREWEVTEILPYDK